jgi:two-component system response regulator FixJ
MSAGSVYVLDDDADLAGSVARFLGRQGYEAQSFDEIDALLQAYARSPAECVVADVMMPTMTGFEFADVLLQEDHSATIVFMTAWPKTDDAVQAIRDHGGFDYVAKPLDEGRLLDAVSAAVARSKRYAADNERLSSLSAREKQVFELIVRGYTNKRVALELELSVRTVEDHRASIMRKTGTGTLAGLIELDTRLRHHRVRTA